MRAYCQSRLTSYGRSEGQIFTDMRGNVQGQQRVCGKISGVSPRAHPHPQRERCNSVWILAVCSLFLTRGILWGNSGLFAAPIFHHSVLSGVRTLGVSRLRVLAQIPALAHLLSKGSVDRILYNTSFLSIWVFISGASGPPPALPSRLNDFLLITFGYGGPL